MKNYFHPIAIFTKMNILRFFRDKTYIFFMFILPVCFLLVFGMMYSGNNLSSFKVTVFDHANSELSTSLISALTTEGSVIERSDSDNMTAAENRLINGDLSAIVIFPADFGTATCQPADPATPCAPSGQVQVIYGKNSEQAGQAISAVITTIATETNYQILGGQPAITVKSEALTREGLTTFDYVFAGLLGYTILTVGLLGVANLMPGDKQTGALKRLRATTISPSQIIISYALTFLLIGIISYLLMIIIGLFVFDFHMRGNWLTFAIFTAISTLMMLGFGLFVGGCAKNEAQASVMGNLLMFPMMFLGGVFFPIFMMPETIQFISKFIPLTPIVDGIRLIITENYGLLDILPQIGIIGLWTAIIYALAIKTFRWE